MQAVKGFQDYAKLINRSSKDSVENPDGVLDKDSFMKLLLTELKYQDPTEPTDTEKILTQTSQLATLEASDNTNKALENLGNTLKSTSQLSTISAIGKMGSLGANTISVGEEDTQKSFEIYFPKDVKSGYIHIKDIQGNSIKDIEIKDLDKGINTFNWDLTDAFGKRVKTGSYSIEANYTSSDDTTGETMFGVYPIESVKFIDGKANLKLGSNYFPIEKVVEIY